MTVEATVVRVSYHDGQRNRHGTGFLVDLIPDDRGVDRVGILTAHHNLPPQSEATLDVFGRRWEGDTRTLVQLSVDRIVEYELANGSGGGDWVLLQLAEPPESLKRILNMGPRPLTVPLRAAAPTDREFSTLGFHIFDRVSTDSGTIHSLDAEDAQGRRAIHITGSPTLLGAPGFSGAPVQARADGYVVGLIRQGASNSAGNDFFAMDARRVLGKAERWLLSAQPYFKRPPLRAAPGGLGTKTPAGPTSIPDSGPPPAGAPYDPATFAPRDDETKRALSYLAYGKPALLWGPESFGKTWMLRYLGDVLPSVMQQHLKLSVKVVNVNLYTVRTAAQRRGGPRPSGTPIAFDDFYRELSRQIAKSFHPALDLPAETGVDLLEGVLREVITRMSEALVLLSVDHADSILEDEFSDDFFFHLRGLAEAEAWRSLRLLVAASTTSGLLLKNFSSSPFEALSQPITLHDLSQGAVIWLAGTYGVTCSDEELKTVDDLIGGHPYLLRTLMYEARQSNAPISALATPKSPVFADFLGKYRERLEGDPELQGALNAVWRHQRSGGPIGLAQHMLHRLQRAGLVSATGEKGYRLRYALYEQLAG